MPLFASIAAVCWVVFIVVWAFSALRAKKSLPTTAWRNALILRMFIVAAVVAILKVAGGRASFGVTAKALLALSPAPEGALGASLCILGIGLAVWARAYLGRNWGMPMTLREQPELVTTGPYSYIRHPIYTGVLLAMLGTALAAGLFWLIVFVSAGIYFIWGATREEKDMLARFPSTYPAYKARTKMLIPFVF